MDLNCERKSICGWQAKTSVDITSDLPESYRDRIRSSDLVRCVGVAFSTKDLVDFTAHLLKGEPGNTMHTGKNPQPEGPPQNFRPGTASKVGFAFSTKDRVEFTRRSLASVDTCGGFDLLWVDGSDTSEGKALPEIASRQNPRIVEVHRNVEGGPDAAIWFGLWRLLQRGYDYCGLIENDIEFEPGWFSELMELFDLGKRDGLEVGAASVRSIESRVLIHRPGYVIKWNMGAGMVLFTRLAAKIVLADYGADTSRELSDYYARKFAVNLRAVWELYMGKPDRVLGCDWSYAKSLYEHGLCSVGAAPSLAFNIDADVERVFQTAYVKASPGPTQEDDRRFAFLVNQLSRARRSSRCRRVMAMAWYSTVNRLLGKQRDKRRTRWLIHPFTQAKRRLKHRNMH